jgi:hypothetical protein
VVTGVVRRPHDRLTGPGPGAPPPAGGAGQWTPIIVLVALVVASLAGWWLGRDDPGSAHRVEAGGGALATVPEARVLGNAQEAAAPSPTTAATTPPTKAAVAPPTTVASRRAPAARTVGTSAPAPASTPTVAPATTSAAPPAVTNVTHATTAPTTTTTTTVAGCRNSAEPACGPFRFDPQPGPDSPMIVQVDVEPAAPVAGQEVVFRLTLTDPDGVSYNGTVFGFGDGGIAGASYPPCERFGPWDPPPRQPASATEVVLVRHTYHQPGTYAVSFAFEAGPFACVDIATGRGDRPYASSATGTATVVVG